MGSSGHQLRAVAGIDGGAGGEHVIDQYQPLSYDFGLLVYRYPEGVLYIVGPLGFGLAYLLRRGARPFDSAVAAPARAIQRPIIGARSSRWPYLKLSIGARAISS